MLNVLWFKPEGGAEQYEKYLRAVGPVAARYGGKKQHAYKPDLSIIGDLDADLLFFVEWPSWEVFQSFVNDPEFQAVRHLRESALSKSLLIRCREIG